MKVFARIDEALIARTENACRRFQRLSGKTNYWLSGKASFVIVFSLAVNMMAHFAHNNSTWLRWFGPAFDGNPVDWFAFPFLLFIHTLETTWHWRFLESRAFERISKGLANPQKISRSDGFYRLSFLCFFIVWHDLFWVAVIAIVHLQACDPLPPCAGRLKELLTFRKPMLAKAEG